MVSFLKRLVAIAGMLVGLSAVLFALLSAMPGDPVEMLITSNPRVRPEDVTRLKKLRGLDRALPVRYWRWLYGSYEGKRPPQVQGLPDASAELVETADGVRVEVSLAGAATAPDVSLSDDETVAAVTAAAPEHILALKQRPSTQSVAQWVVETSAQDSTFFRRLEAARVQKAQQAVTFRGLFGAQVERTEAGAVMLSQTFTVPGVHAMWAAVRGPAGMDEVVRAVVFVAPPNVRTLAPSDEQAPQDDSIPVDAPDETSPESHPAEPEPPPGDDHDMPLGEQFDDEGDESLGMDDDEERQLAGGEAVEPVPRTTEEIIAAASDVPAVLIVERGDPLVLERSASLSRSLTHLVSGGTPPYRFAHAAGPGHIDAEGTFTGDEYFAGQRIVTFRVTDAAGATADAALVVEGDALVDQSRFNRGLLFAFVGDTEALGFSNLYKRPVWTLLAGIDDRCGDGYVDLGEMCDAGQVATDACTSDCMVPAASWWAQLKHRGAGALYRSGRITNTLMLMLPALFLALLIALPAGIVAAVRQYSPFDYVMSFLAFVGISIFVAWFGQMAIAAFAETLKLFPASGIQEPGISGDIYDVAMDRLRHLVLPTCVLATAYAGSFFRYMRGAMLEVLPADFIRTARAKGLSGYAVIMRHALKNALLPVVTVVALTVPRLFGGALLTETVFSWPGIGRLQYDAVISNDYYVAIVVFLIAAALVMLGNLVADMLYRWVDPRTRGGQ